MTNSRSKGKRGELEWRDRLRERGHTARRGQQFQGGTDSPDVVSSLDHVVHWEVKRTEALLLYPAMRQAIADAKAHQVPVVVHRRNGEEWVAVLRASDLLDLLESRTLTKAEDLSGGSIAPAKQ